MEDIRIIHREETFNDLAVRELAKTKATCHCLLQFGRCDSSECARCPTNARLNECVGSMNSYDKLRFDQYTIRSYSELASSPDGFMSHKRYMGEMWYVLLMIALSLVLLIGFFAALGALGDNPRDAPRNEQQDITLLHDEIVDIIKLTQRNVYDINRDRQINCMDYSFMFKRLWDRKYGHLAYCSLIVNRNRKTGMNHMFIQVKPNILEQVRIEPWAPDPEFYLMEQVWGKRYDKRYDVISTGQYMRYVQ